MNNSLLKKLIIIALAICLVFTAIGCANGETEVYVTSVTSSGANALGESVFTVNYSDGSSDTFTLKNGENGNDGADVTIDDIYQKYCVEVENISYEDFLSIYMGSLTVNTTEDLSKSIAKNLTSSLMLSGQYSILSISIFVSCLKNIKPVRYLPKS